jgi:eukaryotic-like serine/threonine-protein kinase
MTLINKTISHYEILSKIGQGGMGEVYRARDSKLNREVAIKVLPEGFTEDARSFATTSRRRTGATYDVDPKGNRFFMIRLAEDGSPTAVRIVLNWFEELRRLAPLD